MKALKHLLNFYINSSIHVALAVCALTGVTFIELGLKYDPPLLYFVFYASITGYNFVKFFGIAKFHHRQLTSWLKFIQILSLICFVLMGFYLLKLPLKSLLFLSCFFVLTLLYAIPSLPLKKRSLRDVSGLKVFIIAIVWTGVTVFLPLVHSDNNLNTDVVLLAVQRFIYVFVLMLPFEIRDLKFDDCSLSTIPQKLGVKKTKRLGVLLLLLMLVLECFKGSIGSIQGLILLTIAFLTALFVIFSKTSQGKYYSSFWVESLPIIWLVLMLIFI